MGRNVSRTLAFASSPIPTWTRHSDLAECRFHRRAAGIFAGAPFAAGAIPMLLQVFIDLLRDNQLLQSFLHRFAFI